MTPHLRADMVDPLLNLIASAFLAFALLPGLTFAQETAPADPLRVGSNPFADFETHILENGLRVWYKRMPGKDRVAAGVVVPYGRDQDPEGLEQLAHFTEHMLFADHMGLSEREINRQVRERGGWYNGFTTSDRTAYWVTMPAEHGLFALDWLYRVISPHAMDPAVVDRNRTPVAVEVGAEPPDLMSWLVDHYLAPPALRPPADFWAREFGMRTRWTRDYDPYRSLHRITPDDLRRFYDTYYVPSRMTLTVVGDLPRDSVLATVRRTFATLDPRPEPEARWRIRDPNRRWAVHYWWFQPSVSYDRAFKVYELDAATHQRLLFLDEWLQLRLTERLRYGERKAVYGVSSSVYERGPVARLRISAAIKPEELDYARDVIEGEIELLRTGALSQAEFEEERQALLQRLRGLYDSPADLRYWALNHFYHPDRYRDFPDLIRFIEETSKDELTAFAAQTLVAERESFQLGHRQPVGEALMLFLLLGVVGATVRVSRKRWIEPVRMETIRYTARILPPLPYRIVLYVGLAVGMALALRLLAHAYQAITVYGLFPVESWWVQHLVFALMVASFVWFVVLTLSFIPRKIQVFTDHVRVKYLSYRSRVIPPANIEEVAVLGFRDVWLTARIRRCVPLTLGLQKPGLYLEPVDGNAYFVPVRDTETLQTAIEELRDGNGQAPEP